MSTRHPIIAVTGSSGTATAEVRAAFEHILFRADAKAAFVQGDGFHKHDRNSMREVTRLKRAAGDQSYSHFRPEANLVDRLDELFRSYGQSGTGKTRYYVHSAEDAARYGKRFGTQLKPGQITPWEDIPAGTDLLAYQGLHGMLTTDQHDIASHVDLGIGLVPTVNLEWIQKICRDRQQRGYSQQEIVASILRRMPDYINYITPQFSRTDINFQRVPCVDTSDPFIASDVPTMDESVVVIRFRKPEKFDIDFPYLLSRIETSFMSRRNTLVVHGGKMAHAMEVILEPIIQCLLDKRKTA